MKFLPKYKSILIISILGLGIVGCKNSTYSKTAEQVKTDSSSISDEIDTTSELTAVRSTSVKPKRKINFDLPNGYKLYEKVQGDLNGDGLPDYVLVIKGTEKENIVVNRFDEEVDRNRRGIMIYLTTEENTVLATKNLNCFSSENEDGGVYFPPELSVNIENGKLYIHYGYGRYGHWKYTFRYQNSNFKLIGYDSSENYGPIINRETSINFLTKKKFIRENVNPNIEASGDEIFEEKWENIAIEKLYKLSDIEDFDELNIIN